MDLKTTENSQLYLTPTTSMVLDLILGLAIGIALSVKPEMEAAVILGEIFSQLLTTAQAKVILTTTSQQQQLFLMNTANSENYLLLQMLDKMHTTPFNLLKTSML